MLNNNTPPTDHTASLKQQLFALCDAYSEFNDCCAFFCKAASVLVLSDDIDFNQEAASGAARFAQALIERSQYVNDQLQWLLREAAKQE